MYKSRIEAVVPGQRVVLILTALVVCLCSALITAADKYVLERDIVYAKVGTSDLRLDLARPSDETGPFPALANEITTLLFSKAAGTGHVADNMM